MLIDYIEPILLVLIFGAVCGIWWLLAGKPKVPIIGPRPPRRRARKKVVRKG